MPSLREEDILMVAVCPICKGEGKALPHNGVDQKETEPKTCWMCAGSGKVEEHKTEKIHIRKYYGTFAG